MATASLFSLQTPQLREDEVYPTRFRNFDIRQVFSFAALALDGYDRLKQDKIANNIGNAVSLIHDAGGYLFKNDKGRRFNFIQVYRPLFPEIDVEVIRNIDVLSKMFSEKIIALGFELCDPSRLSGERRRELSGKLITLSNEILTQQHRSYFYW